MPTTLLGSFVVSQQQATMELDVPGGYTNARLIIQGSSSYAANDVQFGLQANGDQNAVYLWQSVRGSNTTSTVASGAGDTRAVLGRVPGSLALPYHSGFAEVFIPNYLALTFFPSFICRWGESWNVTAGAMSAGLNAGVYTGFVAPVTKLTVTLDNGLWIAGSQLLLYGE